MNLNNILQKTWQMLWHYRALWLFGAVLALVGANVIFPGFWSNRQEYNQWLDIKLSNNTTIRLPGADMTIDFTAPGGVRIFTQDGNSLREFRDLVELLNREASIDLWPILIEFAVILIGVILLSLITRYIAETALIRMVNEAEAFGVRMSVWQGIRRGLSIQAVRLFLLDLIVGVLAVLAFILVFGLAIAPVLLAIGSHEAILITAGVGTFGLLVLATFLWLAAGALLSLFLQMIRRACVLEDQSLLASIRQGISMTRQHLKEVGMIWLVWMGIRLAWVPLGLIILILLTPVLLLTVLAGIFAGGIPAVLVVLIADLFASEPTSWIMGALAGLPLFFIVMISPILFIEGLVETYMSSMWTLAYRDLKALESPLPAPMPVSPKPLAQASGAAG